MPKKNKPIDPEENKRLRLKRMLEESAYLPTPTYYFELGDEVEYGNLQDIVIVDIFDDGKVYEIDCTSINNNYGNPIVNKHVRHYVTWLDVRPLSPEDHDIISNDDLQLRYSQMQLSSLLTNLYSFRTNMNPVYQRDYVWSNNDKILLIDSIFNNIDIGKFVFIHLPYAPDSPSYEILDGKQRLNALAGFYENRFSYRDLFFNDLSRHEKYQFTNYPVSVAELTDITEQQKLRYFLTLNRTGKVMDQKHLEKVEAMLNEV